MLDLLFIFEICK